jgi:hypothetical protein
MTEPNVLLRPEYTVALVEEEIEFLLDRTHERLAHLLEYLDRIERIGKGTIPESSVRRRAAAVRNLAAKLELSLTHKETSNEERKHPNRNRGDHPAESSGVSQVE